MTDATAFVIAYAAKASVVLAVAAVGARLLSRAAAATRHWVWVAGTVAVLVLPIAMIIAPRFVVRVAALPQNTAVHALLAPAPEPLASSAEPPPVPATLRAPANTVRAVDAERVRSVEASSSSPRNDQPTALWIWAMAAAFLGARALLDVVRARRLRSRSQLVTTPEIVALVREFAGDAGAHRVRVLSSSHIAAPMTAGLMSHDILLPADHRGWSNAERRAIMAHEVAHALRRDCTAQLAARLVCAIHWFNPLAWYAARALRAEAERACDDRVLFTGAPSLAYAELLVRFARDPIAPAHARLALPMATRGAELERRVEAIVDPGVRRGAASVRARVSVGMLVGAALVVAATARLEAGRITAPTAAARRDPPLQAPSRATSLESRLASAARPVRPDVGDAARVHTRPVALDTELVSPRTVNDTLADPRSERIPLVDETLAAAHAATETLNGPDSVLAHVLFTALEHVPQHEGDLVAERAAWALAQAVSGRLVEPLIDALASPDWREASYASWALARVPDARALVPLIALLEHGAWRARAAAAGTLAALGDAAAADAMRAVLNDEAWQVRAEAVEYFAALGDAQSLAAIRPALMDVHVAVRTAAQGALAGRR